MHVGCDEAFVEAGEWREHVLAAHHGIQKPPREVTKDVGDFEEIWNEKVE